MKSDEVAMKAEEAKTALTGLAEVRTGGPKAAMHADEAAAAAAAAKAAYDTAKDESDKAADATVLTPAVTVQAAAEKAQMAAEKAQMAKDAAPMEVVHVEGMTYRVGHVSITAGAPKRTVTRDCVARVTGKVSDWVRTLAPLPS